MTAQVTSIDLKFLFLLLHLLEKIKRKEKQNVNTINIYVAKVSKEKKNCISMYCLKFKKIHTNRKIQCKFDGWW